MSTVLTLPIDVLVDGRVRSGWLRASFAPGERLADWPDANPQICTWVVPVEVVNLRLARLEQAGG